MAALKLSWDSVQNAVSYNVYWKTSSGVTKTNSTIISGVTDIFYRHQSLLISTIYYYSVAAVDIDGNVSPLSVEFSALTSNE